MAPTPTGPKPPYPADDPRYAAYLRNLEAVFTPLWEEAFPLLTKYLAGHQIRAAEDVASRLGWWAWCHIEDFEGYDGEDMAKWLTGKRTMFLALQDRNKKLLRDPLADDKQVTDVLVTREHQRYKAGAAHHQTGEDIFSVRIAAVTKRLAAGQEGATSSPATEERMDYLAELCGRGARADVLIKGAIVRLIVDREWPLLTRTDMDDLRDMAKFLLDWDSESDYDMYSRAAEYFGVHYRTAKRRVEKLVDVVQKLAAE